jgi:Flp pilus assembly protein TadD
MRLDGVPGLEFQRADALARLGRVAEAESAYRARIARFPRHLQAWANLACCCSCKAARPIWIA